MILASKCIRTMYAHFSVRRISTLKNTIYKDRFKDKVAVVVGSTAGIGLSIAQRFAAEGGYVVICSRKQANVTKALETFKNQPVIGTTCHVQNPEDRQNLLKFTLDNFKKINYLINVAGINPYVGPTLQTPDSVIDKILDVNVKCPLVLSQLFEPHMEDNGSILFIGSVSATDPLNMLGMYSASKAALMVVSRCIAAEAGPRVRVNCINVGPCETKFGNVLHTNKNIENFLLKNSVTDKFADPEDVASLVGFLCSDNSMHFHGETIRLSGGYGARFGN